MSAAVKEKRENTRDTKKKKKKKKKKTKKKKKKKKKKTKKKKTPKKKPLPGGDSHNPEGKKILRTLKFKGRRGAKCFSRRRCGGKKPSISRH